MSTTLFEPSARLAIHARIDGLSPESVRRWGSMSANEMVCHVADQLRGAIGDIEMPPGPLRIRFGNREVKVSPGLLKLKSFRWIFVHRLPWPRARFGASPGMLTTTPAAWSDDIAALHALVDRVGEKDPSAIWRTHPIFGRISGHEWGLTCWRHLDYHLRQFGV